MTASKFLTWAVAGWAIVGGVAFAAINGESAADLPGESCLYLPPGFADRVVFYDSFERRSGAPEINRIQATLTGTIAIVSDGFAGSGCRSPRHEKGERPIQIHSPSLSLDRPITAMRWWRLDGTMRDVSCFELLSLQGKGHVSCFVRGKGEWCALQRPTMFVQVDHFAGITNVNQGVRDNAYFNPGDWHHVAVTVSNGSQIHFYLDGQPLANVEAKGRQFNSTDVDTYEASADGNDFSDVPTTSDDLTVVDRALSAQEIANYFQSCQNLRQMHYPVLSRAKGPQP